MDTIRTVKKYIDDNRLLADNDKIILGVSGGADSIALLDILVKLEYRCIAAHCNFHLRGEESDRDYSFVKDFCESNSIEFVSVDFDTKKYMKDNSLSLEMAARKLRYNWFEQTRQELQADKIAVAHHGDDSIETVLINLIRGTGIKGLTGIPAQNGYVIRPLLCLSKEEILEYLHRNNLDFITDSTNNESIYTRNKIRLEVIPLLETINPAVKDSIRRLSENLTSVENIYNESVEKIKEKVFKYNCIDIDQLMKVTEARTILFEILYPYGFNPDVINEIFQSVGQQSGKRFYSKEYVVIKDRNKLLLNKITEKDSNTYIINEDDNIKTPVSLHFETLKNDENFRLKKNPHIIYVDKNKITFPLTIRRWQEGDKFVPFGMKGSKKLSDYFSDRKFSLLDKQNVWLLCSGNEIIWIIGERSDDRFKVNSKTGKILKITYIAD